MLQGDGKSMGLLGFYTGITTDNGDDEIAKRMCQLITGEMPSNRLTEGTLGLVVTYFLTLSPLFNLFVFGITSTSAQRVMLHNSRVFSAFFVVCLFFQPFWIKAASVMAAASSV